MSAPTPAQAAFWPRLRRAIPGAPERFTPGKYPCPQCSKSPQDRRLKVGYDQHNHEVTLHCFGGCDRNQLRIRLGVPSWASLRDDRSPKQGTLTGEWTYPDETGQPLFRVTRWTNPSSQRYQHRDDHGDWTLAPKGWRHPWVLYRAQQVAEATEAEETIYLCASEADADAATQHGGVGTATPEPPGKGGFRVEYAEALRGAYVRVVAVKTAAGREQARLASSALSGRAADVALVEPAIAKPGATLRDHLDPQAGFTLDDLAPLTLKEWGGDKTGPPPAPPARCSLASVEKLFGILVDKGDLVALRATLACYAANLHLDGDPVWLGLVSGSSTGKTETALALRQAPRVLVASTLSGEAALLSGTPAKERSDGATGGLLREVGDRGLLVLKDFTSIISMNRDKRGIILAALREVYDGYWSRRIGGEGGTRLEWSGKAGMVMCSTTAYDRAHGVIAELGDRFILVRIADDDPESGMLAGLAGAGQEDDARAALASAVAGLLGHPPEHAALGPDDDEKRTLAGLANFVTLARSPVARDYRGEVELVHDREGPYRFGKQLYSLWRACGLLGMASGQAWEVAARVCRDSMPKLRWRVVAALASRGELTTRQVCGAVRHPKQTTRRTLEDLTAHRVATRREVEPLGDLWQLTGRPGQAARALLAPIPVLSPPHSQDEGAPDD